MTVLQWAQRRVNPVAVKELRGAFRGNRYLMAHMTIVGLCALAMFFMLFSMTVMSQSMSDTSQIGTRSLHAAQVTHLVVIFLVVPAFAATSLSSERERQTLDLMLATGLKARSIVWGKFVSAMMLTGLLFVALMPIVSLCFLFGGITVYQIVANYFFFALLSALLVSIALAISAGSGTVRAVITTYLASGLIGIMFIPLAGGLAFSGMGRAMMETYGFFNAQELSTMYWSRFGAVTLEWKEIFVAAYVIPGFLWAVATAFFFLLAANRLKPQFANLTTGLRIFYVVALIILTGVILPLSLWAFEPRLDVHRETMLSLVLMLLILGTLSCYFTLENPFLPLHLKHRADADEKRGWHVWMFHPGSRTGVVFVMTVNGIAVLLALAWWVLLRSWEGCLDPAELIPMGVAVGVLVVWLWFAAGVGAMLSGLARSRPLLARVLFLILVVVLTLMPVLHFAFAERAAWDEGRTLLEAPLTAAVSPLMAISAGLRILKESHAVMFPIVTAGHTYIPVLFCVVMGVGGFAFNFLARRRYWASTRQQEHERALMAGEK